MHVRLNECIRDSFVVFIYFSMYFILFKYSFIYFIIFYYLKIGTIFKKDKVIKIPQINA